MRKARIFLELNDTAFRHLEKAEVVLTYKDILQNGTKTQVIPISKRSMKYKAQYTLSIDINET